MNSILTAPGFKPKLQARNVDHNIVELENTQQARMQGHLTGDCPAVPPNPSGVWE